jgi:hypothetical protein
LPGKIVAFFSVAIGTPQWSLDPREARAIDDEDLPEALAALCESLDPVWIPVEKLNLDFTED